MHKQQKKTAIVTGASSGIGYGIAKYLLEQQYRVIMIAQNQSRLLHACETLTQVTNSNNIIPLPVDITDNHSVANTLSRLTERSNGIDILVNSAGYVKRGTSELEHEDFTRMLATNLEGVFNVTSMIVSGMKERNYGHIFNISSYSGIVARSSLGGYAASKFGLMGYNESLHKELAPYGIKVTAICPNLVDTPMTKDVTSVQKSDLIPVEDVVNTVDYLLNLSPNAMIREVSLQCRSKLLNEADR